MKNWKIPFAEPNIPDDLLRAGYPPLLAAVLALRGIRTAEQADCEYGGAPLLYDPLNMLGMRQARDRVLLAIERKEKVAVYGDYDVDGITATCLLSDYLIRRGLSCRRYIPNREDEGYGLNSAALDLFAGDGISLVITVDCGITAAEEAAHAKEIGIDLIITDHHECPEGPVPDAVAVVDMKRADDPYENKNLAGVGVAFKLVCACEGSAELPLELYSDLVAIGTVSDVMSLRGENRYLVRSGLKKINNTPRPWICAVLGDSFDKCREVTAATIGYTIAPRLNAAGRLGKAEVALRLLSEEDPDEIREFAATLVRLNEERKEIEQEIWREVLDLLGNDPPSSPIVLSGDKWNPGVIGIVASRLTEHYSLPSIMICASEESGTGKGSCRSYGDFNLYDALGACSEHLLTYGGHALAAGLRLRLDKVDDFRSALAAYYRDHRPETIYEVEGELLIRDPKFLTPENVASLAGLEPFGTDNPKPVMLLYGVPVDSVIGVGGNRHTKMKVTLREASFDAICFAHTPEDLGISNGSLVDIAFLPQINEFRGKTAVQLQIQSIKIHDGSELCRRLLEPHPESCCGYASRFLPERNDFIQVWHAILRKEHPAGDSLEELLASVPEGMDPEKYFICLLTFYQAGLLINDAKDSLFGARICSLEEKADLSATPIMRSLSGGPAS